MSVPSTSTSSRGVELVCLTHPGSCNGVCHQDTGVCECPPGGYWVDDTSLFRYQNCSVPYWYNVVVTSLCLATSFFLQVYIALYYRNKQGFARYIIRYASLTNISTIIACIAHLAYGGANPAFWFAMAVGVFAAASGFTTYLIAFFTLTYKTAKKPVPEQTLKAIYIISVTSCSIPPFFFAFVGSMYYLIPGLPSFNPAGYNNMVAIFAAALPVQLLLTGPLLVIISNRLIGSMLETVKRARSLVVAKSSNLESPSHVRDSVKQTHPETNQSSADASVQSIIKRLTLFRNVMVFGAIPGEMIPCVIVALLHFLFRFQYIYVLFFILLIVLQFSVVMYVVAAGKENTKASGGSRGPSIVHGTGPVVPSSKSPHVLNSTSPIKSKTFEGSIGSEGKKTEIVQSESGDASSSGVSNPNNSYQNLLQASYVSNNPKTIPDVERIDLENSNIES